MIAPCLFPARTPPPWISLTLIQQPSPAQRATLPPSEHVAPSLQSLIPCASVDTGVQNTEGHSYAAGHQWCGAWEPERVSFGEDARFGASL